jgi:hypothetical protein
MSDHENYCSGKTKQGQPCRAAATETGYCFFHTNPGRVAELGRLGGRKNRHVVDVDLRPLPPMDTAEGFRSALDQIAGELYAGRLPPKTAAAMAQLMNTRLRAMGMDDIEQKVKEIETRLDELSSARTAPAANSTQERKN